MTRIERAQAIGRILDSYFPDPAVPLNHRSTYELLIAVLLSAQCTDVRVNLVTPHLFALADTPEKMMALSVAKVEAIIRPCGLAPSKAKAIVRLSELLVERHAAEVPQDFAALEALPGVGHKTASVVMVQAFSKPAFPVDSHIHRVAWRWKLSLAKNVVQTERDLKKLFPKQEWGRRHLQIIYFARTYCPARGHKRLSCPICKDFGRPDRV